MHKRKVFPISNEAKLVSPTDCLTNYKTPFRTIEYLMANPIVNFEENPTTTRTADFSKWYGVGIDDITASIHDQILRFLDKTDAMLEVSSVVSLTKGGMIHFLNFMAGMAKHLNVELKTEEINRQLIDDFIGYVKSSGIKAVSQRGHYLSIKSVLMQLGVRKLFDLVSAGDNATFPRNPFPNVQNEGAKPYSQREKAEIIRALRSELRHIFEHGTEIDGETLSYIFLTVAFYTGRNLTALLEAGPDCLKSHPKNDNVFFILNKRRGRSTSKVALHPESDPNVDIPLTIKTNIADLIRFAIKHSDSIRDDSPERLKKRIWLYRVPNGPKKGDVVVLKPNTLIIAVSRLVQKYRIKDADGVFLKINTSRMRKTFANRIFEILDEDLAATAIALGNTPKVAGRNYLAPSEVSQKNWKFMGEILVEEMLTGTIGATYKKTEIGLCSDPINGEYAPKKSGEICFSFINCLRCRHYAVSGDDLYRLFSFYYRVLSERSKINKVVWAKQYAHIPRLIDNYIIPEGIKRKYFDLKRVEEEKNKARLSPHSFWTSDVVGNLGDLA